MRGIEFASILYIKYLDLHVELQIEVQRIYTLSCSEGKNNSSYLGKNNAKTGKEKIIHKHSHITGYVRHASTGRHDAFRWLCYTRKVL